MFLKSSEEKKPHAYLLVRLPLRHEGVREVGGESLLRYHVVLGQNVGHAGVAALDRA